MNAKQLPTKYKDIMMSIIDKLISCSDGKYITEIYAKDGSIVDGEFTNWVGLMIETDTEFVNESLYDCINDLEEGNYPFMLHISVEPDTVERGHGITLYKRLGNLIMTGED